MCQSGAIQCGGNLGLDNIVNYPWSSISLFKINLMMKVAFSQSNLSKDLVIEIRCQFNIYSPLVYALKETRKLVFSLIVVYPK